MEYKSVVFRKQRKAQNPSDFETWVEEDVANTLNLFDVGDKRTTTIIVGVSDETDNRT